MKPFTVEQKQCWFPIYINHITFCVGILCSIFVLVRVPFISLKVSQHRFGYFEVTDVLTISFFKKKEVTDVRPDGHEVGPTKIWLFLRK